MAIEDNPLTRRSVLRGTVAGAALLATGGLLAACGSDEPEQSSGPIEANGTNLFHQTLGSGTPMLIMHGGLGLDHEYFRPTLDSWGDFAQLVYFDHRGNGRSDAPADYTTISMDTLAADADALRAALDFDKVVLFGHSYGGFIALEYAIRFQENLSGLILGSTLPRLGYDLNPQEWGSEAAFESFGKLFAGPMASDQEWAETWRAALPVYWKDIDQRADLAADIDSRTTYNANAWNQSALMLAEYDVTAQLGSIEVPTLLLSGRQDFITVAQGHEDMHAALPNSELVFFEDSGHFPFITEEDKYRSTVEEWVARL